jgi:excisionase family DNA binding protein
MMSEWDATLGTRSDADEKKRLRPVPRLALSLDEAAAALGCSRDYFDEHIRPELRVVRRGRRVLVSTVELSRWLDSASARALEV